MPMTAAEMEREINALKALTKGFQRSIGELTTRIDELEKREVDLGRLASAAEDIAKAQHGPFGGKP